MTAVISALGSRVSAFSLMIAMALGSLPLREARGDILVDLNDSAGQSEVVVAPGNYTQTVNLIDSNGFAVEINSDNGTNGTFRINAGVTLGATTFSTVVLRPGARITAFDVQGNLISTQFNALNAASTSIIDAFSNSGTIQSQRTGFATLFLPGRVTTFANNGLIEHTAGATALIIDNVGNLVNDTSGTIVSADAMAIRLGFSNPATIDSFFNSGLISGGTTAVELGRQAGSTAGIVNSGTITGVVDGLLVLNGSELSVFDNTGGVLESTGAAGAALHLREDQDIAITNAGILRSTSTGHGLLLDTEGQTRDFTNDGTISSALGTAIAAQTAMTGDSNGFVNSGTIIGGGGTAIEAQDTFRLTNSGAITGHITHSIAGSLAFTHTDGSIAGDITSVADAAHSLELSGGTIVGDIALDGATANAFVLNGTTITGNVDLGDGGAHSVSLDEGRISGSLDIGSGTTALSIDVAGGDAVTIGTLATNGTTTTNISGAGDVTITNFMANGSTEQAAGRLTSTTLSVGASGSFTQSGSGVLDVPVVSLGDAAVLNLNGTTARITGAITGAANSNVFVNGIFASEDRIDVGRFEIGGDGVFNMAHSVTTQSGFSNLGALVIGAGDTVTVSADYTQGANALLRISATDDTSVGRLVVTGTASLPSNAGIDVNVADANFNFQGNRIENVISAGTLVSDGTFIVTDNSNLFDFQAIASGNTVDLCLAATGRDCRSPAGAGGVLAAVVANHNWPGVGAAEVFDDLIDSFVTDGTTGNDGMDDVIGSLGALASQRDVSDAVSQTLPLLTASAVIPIKNALSSTRQTVQSRLTDSGGLSSNDRILAGEHIWTTAFGTGQNHDDRRNVSGFDGHSLGQAIGADGDVDADTRLGLAFAYSNTDIDSDSGLHSAEIDTYQLLGYGQYAFGDATEANAQIGVALSETDGRRTIAFVDDTPVARSNYSSFSFHVGGSMEHRVELSNAIEVSPSLRVDYTRLYNDSYTETGAGALNIDASSNHLSALELGVGCKLHYQINDMASLIFGFDLAYDALNEQAEVTGRFLGGGDTFVTRGIDPSPWIGRLGLGLPIALDDKAQIAIRYDVEGRNDYHSQMASMQFSWKL